MPGRCYTTRVTLSAALGLAVATSLAAPAAAFAAGDRAEPLAPAALEALWDSMAFYPPDMVRVLKTIPVAPEQVRRHIHAEFTGRRNRELFASGDGPAQAWGALANAELGLMEEARGLADASIEARPDFPVAHAVRAYVRFQQGELAGASADAGRALELQPGNAAARAILRLCEGRERLPASALGAPAPRPPGERAPPFPPPEFRPAPPRPDERSPSPPHRQSGPPVPLVIAVLSISFLIAMALFKGIGWTATRFLGRGRQPAPAAVPAPSSGLRDYDLVRPIGRGGMGVVYEAKDRLLDRRVAVKKMREEIRDDPRERERFLKEARLVAGLRHPGIVEIHAIVAEGDELALVFEYVEGRTVDALLGERGRLPLAEVTGILRVVCDALDYAHARQIVHRDLKPSNVMVGAGGLVKVMDFGIARQAKDAVAKLSITNTVAGTPLYMPPEAESGLVCRESDVYSLAAMTYEMLTGSSPFPGSATTEAKRARRYQAPSGVVAGLPASVDRALHAALDPDPATRTHTAAEFLAGLSQKLS